MSDRPGGATDLSWYSSNQAAVPQLGVRFLVNSCASRRRIGKQIIESLGKQDPGRESEKFPGLRYVREAMTHIPDAVLSGGLKRDVAAESRREGTRELQDARGATRANIEDLAIGLGIRERQQIRLIDIAHMDEVAGLPPIFVDDRSAACRYLQCKVLGHAGVR